MNQDEAVGRLKAIQGEIEKSSELELEKDDDPERVLTVIRGIADPTEPFLPL